MSEKTKPQRPLKSERQAENEAAFITAPAVASPVPDLGAPMRDHALCLARLREHVYGSRHGDSFPAESCHTRCALGRWLSGEVGPYRTLAGYRSVEDAHAEFHRSADQVLALLDQGRRLDATRAVETSGSVRQASRALVRALHTLREEIRATEGQLLPMNRSAEPAKSR